MFRAKAVPNTTAWVLLFESKLYRSLLYESCMYGPGRYLSTLCVSTRFCVNRRDFEQGKGISKQLGALPLGEGGGAKHSPLTGAHEKS